ncbi:uncharacterized protein LOC122243452 [Penaeus japonicus]|uniref:uncharacterized protein LOC122243452 n=1 Tax=Penaeus japonicus TaxID=27405 RepID=UPI001C70C33E|nr:uncharacterized protein LOC122243452 [Penaeus japonicus]XP_042856990.1 uncharacterized protein LOC122243452 [Penaeus japonicus]XP_042856991.1 uncharacterized protein LOC122243452 [Penaeus japonicus]
MTSESKVLRLATYMCPSLPVEYYEFLADYLETELGTRTILLYDSRRPGPDSQRGDDERIDIAFVRTSTYIEKFRASNKFKLLPVSAATKHPVKGEVHGYFADIVVHRDVRDRVKEFLDLRGCKYAYASENSISSARQVLLSLKQMGENASFFSNVQASGDHMNSLEMVVAKKAEATAVDSIALTNYLSRFYYQEPELHLQESWGPLPPHPILINTKLSDEVQGQIERVLLHLHNKPDWLKQLTSFGITRFCKSSSDVYFQAVELMENTKSLSLGVTYY